MRFNPKADISGGRVSDVRGGGGRGAGLGGLPMGAITGGGVGTTIVVIVIFVIIQLVGGGSGVGSGGPQETTDRYEQCRTGADANQDADCALVADVNSIQSFWKDELPRAAGVDYAEATTTIFSGQTQTGCGAASSSTGPFYCPVDKHVYLDTTFFKDMLQGQLGAKGGPFSQAYVLAHEYGHHVQDLLGTMSKVRSQQGATSGSVRLELQADCYAGIWTKHATTADDSGGQPYIIDLTPDDINRALDAAAAVGDDRIQQKTSGRVDPDAWTHGSSEQRMRWFTTGMKKGTLKACDTFSTNQL